MKNFALALFCLALFANKTAAQQLQPEVSRNWFPKKLPERYATGFYFYWGYNRASYSTSTLHLKGPSCDFTLYDVKAHDRPTKFTFDDYFSPTEIWIPQYNYRLGYHINHRWAVSLGLDHMKYVVDLNQVVRMSGVINESASPYYSGAYLNRAVLLEYDLLNFEHTDGFNLVSLDAEYKRPVYLHPSRHFAVEWMLGAGGMWPVTKTDVRVFGKGINNDFQIPGLAFAGKTGLKFYFFKRLFVMAETKVGYATLPSIRLEQSAATSAAHNFFFWEKTGAIGFNFYLKKRTRAHPGQ